MDQGCLFSEMPGVAEALLKAQSSQFTTRENSLLDLTYDLCGVKVRTMTIRDYVLLDKIGSPFLYRKEPSVDELGLFLWMLSPQFIKWVDGKGWRGWMPMLQPLAALFYGSKVRRMFGENPPVTTEPLVVECFKYIDTMFLDSPPSVANGSESCLSYLTGWFDSLQSEYRFTKDEVWTTGLPELFQRLNAIRQRRNPGVPAFNRKTDSVKAFVIRGLRNKEFTLDDLKAGKVVIPANN